jgi:hypothetical protein
MQGKNVANTIVTIITRVEEICHKSFSLLITAKQRMSMESHLRARIWNEAVKCQWGGNVVEESDGDCSDFINSIPSQGAVIPALELDSILTSMNF